MSDRRSFLGWLATLPTSVRAGMAAGTPPLLQAQPTALYQQPDGHKNLVRITVSGLDTPAARATVTDRHGALAGSAGLLPAGEGSVLQGEVWLPLSEPTAYRVDLEVGKQRLLRTNVRLTPPRRWTLYWLATNHTDVGYTDVQERCLEIHRQNLDAAVARLATHPGARWSAECALQVISYVENRSPQAADALLQAIRDGKIGFHALFANMLTGILDHDTFARVVWPAGLLARERGLTYAAAQITDVPGQALTFPMVLAASGVKYLASGPNPERALPLLPESEGKAYGLTGPWTAYPQLYWWESPDGSRVLHWRNYHYGDGLRFGFDVGPAEMGRRLSDWLLTNPVFLSPAWPYDVGLLYGAQWDNALTDEQMIANVEEFNRRYAFPRIAPARAEDFFRDVERRWGTQIPVRKGDTGLYWEDGAASTALELALFRRAQLAARAAELVELWSDRLELKDSSAADRAAARAADARAMWRDLLLFGEHTWGASESVSQPDARATVEQWAYKRRFVAGAAAAAAQHLKEGLLRLGHGTDQGRGRIVFNASTWTRSDVARVPGGAGKALAWSGTDLPAVDLPDGDALVVVSDVPGLGYVALAERDRAPTPLSDEGAATDAQAGGFHVRLDPATGAIQSLVGPDGKERVKPSSWSGLNQLVYVRGGERSALWTAGDRHDLATPPQLAITQAAATLTRRERLPGIGVRLVTTRTVAGCGTATSTVTLYDTLPWVDIENEITKTPVLEKEALYVAFPFAFVHPTVQLEVPLGRMAVEKDQQPASARDWYCHTHWVWLTEGQEGVLWSAPDTPLLTLNDVFRGAWPRTLTPDGTVFAYALNNYWHTNYAASQGGTWACRFRISLLGPGDLAEPVRRGWAACDPLYVSAGYDNATRGPLIAKDRALILPDQGALVVAAKAADDGDGAIVRLLDVAGSSRSVGIWPAAYGFAQARRANLVEMNGDALPLSGDRHAGVDLRAWGVAAVRLFTPRERAG